MRPSKLKTPLAKLRAMLKVQTGEKTKKRTGQTLKTYAPLSRKDVADWLGCGVDNISSIESGRVKLTEENAEIIALKTGVSIDWLLAGDVSKPPVKLNWTDGSRKKPYGEGRYMPYTQKDFDERQKSLSRSDSNGDLEHARITVAFSCAKIAAILARGLERGKPVEYALKPNQALPSIYFDKDEEKLGRVDLNPPPIITADASTLPRHFAHLKIVRGKSTGTR